eukprot:TRINITY_DN8582_c0_g2_i2.p1 TRINITY_DN8582_c0_g2~~TRINITY_DN8582_c0_g2_i2.p1  ORF type:complete len:178 (-),score=32.59 TRINITY_DN8582_c0_g2_i2:457-990(-)
METVGIQDNTLYASRCLVRNTFIEVIPILPSLARCKNEPKTLKWASSQAPGNANTDESEGKNRERQTCVIVRDLPCKVGSERMVAELDNLGFHGCYDSLIFQKNGKKGKASFVGYGFIYFKSEDYASEFISRFANHQFKDIKSKKLARAELARADGDEWHVRRSMKKAHRVAQEIAA